MHTARRTMLQRCVLTCVLSLFALSTSSVASARSVARVPAIAKAAIPTSARLTITDAVFSRATIVVRKGGTLTLTNADNVPYRIKVGATLIVLPANESKTVPLPQRGTFSITCAKAPSLRATLTVK